MNEHLPECWATDPSDPAAWCICDELRACEERVTALATPETVMQANYWYEQGQRDVFALHAEWTVAGMCKPDCLPCQRLTELIVERSKGYDEGQREALADAVQIVEELPCKCNEGADYCDGQTDAIAAITLAKGDQP